MNADLRASLLVGAAAAGLSLLVGVLSGVPFFPLLVRALLFALLFGGLVYGAALLLRSFVPELFDASRPPVPGEGELDLEGEEGTGLGGAVDIVLESTDEAGELAPAPVQGDYGEEEPLLEAEPVDFSGLGRGAPGAPASVSTRFEAAEGPRSASVPPARQSPGIDELDMLPDLDSFSGSFGALDISSPAPGEGAPSPSSGGGGGTTSRSDLAGPGGADPATLAMAVRTLLKRDQKG